MTREERFAAALLFCAAGYAVFDATRVGDTPVASPAVPNRAVPFVAAPSDGEAIVARALFLPSRRADFDDGAAPGAMIGGYVLRGTLTGVAGRLAIFEPADGSPARRLRLGDRLAGYALAAIEAESVTLVRGTVQRRIDIGDPSAPELPGGSGSSQAVAPLAPTAGGPPPAIEPPQEVLPVITTTDVQGQ